jgi:hypothetical protein
MLPAPSLVHRTPGPAIGAAVLGVVSATVPALALLFVAVMAGSELWESDAAWLLVPVALVARLIARAVLLLLGRSWLALALPSVRHWVAARRWARALPTAESRP